MNTDSQKLGITNLTPIVLLVVEAGNVADKMGRSKGMARYMHLTSLFDELLAFGRVDFAAAKAEYGDRDDVEKAQIKAEVKAKFDLVDDDLEDIIEDSFDAMENIYGGFEKCIGIYKRVKAKISA